MKKIVFYILLILALAALVGCADTSESADVSIVCTAFPQYDFARQITEGTDVSLTMLIKPGSEAHSYEPTPNDRIKIDECDLFIGIGGESETWAEAILSSGEGRMTVLNITDSVELIDTAEAAGAKVTFHGKIYDAAEKQKIFDRCHFGLNIMKDSVCVGLTLKSMDYLAGGLPIINNIPGDTWVLVESQGIGINFANDSALSEQALLKPQEGRAGIREFFRERFSQEAFLENVGGILRQLEK